ARIVRCRYQGKHLGNSKLRGRSVIQSTTWHTLDEAYNTPQFAECRSKINHDIIRMMTIAALQSFAVVLHTPNPDDDTLQMHSDTILGLAEYLFDQWDRSGFTEEFVKVAPLVLSLNRYARAQLRAFEQETLSTLAIPAEIWSRIWKNYDRRLEIFVAE